MPHIVINQHRPCEFASYKIGTITYILKEVSVPSATMSLKEYLGRDVTVITADGRNIVGKLRGFDKNVNIVLERSHERVFSVDKGVVKNDLGLYLVRGDNIVLVGLLDGEEDAARDLSDVKAQPLKPVVHEVM